MFTTREGSKAQTSSAVLPDLRRHQPLGNLPFPGLLHLLEKGEGIGDVVPQLRIFFLQPAGDLFQARVEKGPLQTAENQIGDEKKAANGVEKSKVSDFFLELESEIASEEDQDDSGGQLQDGFKGGEKPETKG